VCLNTYGCGRDVFNVHENSTPINYTGGFTRRKRFTANIPAKDLIEIGYNEEIDSLMFKWREKANTHKSIYNMTVEDDDIFTIRSQANESGGTWFTVFDDKMKTMSRPIYDMREDKVKMSHWASLIGLYFVRRVEEMYERDLDEERHVIGKPKRLIYPELTTKIIIHMWALSDLEDIFKFEIDLKYLGYAMAALEPKSISMDEMGRILRGDISYGDRWLTNRKGMNVTIREGAYEMKRRMLPGPVSFISDLEHQLVMWDVGDWDATITAASQVVNLDNYVICKHHKGENHHILFKKMFLNVAKEKGDYIVRDFEDLSQIRTIATFTVCGIELVREVCTIFRLLSFKGDLSTPIAIAERVPMVTNFLLFEREVRQTEVGRIFNSIYTSFLLNGYLTTNQTALIEKARKWGRRYRGSDDYGIYTMLVNKYVELNFHVH
jgi:hypothetical protein